ncbi:hypothetical protein QH639_19340 [Lysinibacillus sp. 1 U-2021]|uniref:hypothetical protein n=1 Tax=Lysinibacillus sp. 1 U-2021 TaxID=3039426 RepID=UPI00248065CB|nr:hypothetical protein [Lysinibacillus sp. 1 U-2021]WGT37958.1 hypothetical protein QH639_19340 [Lysinibacillus sp. 1 U-2021]
MNLTNIKELVLSNEQLTVHSSYDMIYIKHKKNIKHDLKKLIKLHAEIVKLCKENKIKVSYKGKSKAYLLEVLKSGEFDQSYEHYNTTFNQLLEGWKEKLYSENYDGCIEDDFYKEHLQSKKFAIDKMLYGGTVLDKVNTIAYNLNELKNNLELCPDDYISVTI